MCVTISVLSPSVIKSSHHQGAEARTPTQPRPFSKEQALLPWWTETQETAPLSPDVENSATLHTRFWLVPPPSSLLFVGSQGKRPFMGWILEQSGTAIPTLVRFIHLGKPMLAGQRRVLCAILCQ